MNGSTRRAVTITGIVVAMVGAGVTVAVASNPAANGVITVCVKGEGEYFPLTACKSGYRAIKWNQTGPRGPRGAPGPTGATGATGAPGQDGADGAGTVLTSSSGDAPNLTTISGFPNSSAVLPISGVGSETISGGSFDPTGDDVGLIQVFPQDATLTSISGRLSTSTAVNFVVSYMRVEVQLVTDPTGGNNLTPVPGASCTLTPDFSGNVPPGTLASCSSTGLTIPVTAGTSAALVFSPSSPADSQSMDGRLAASLSLS